MELAREAPARILAGGKQLPGKRAVLLAAFKQVLLAPAQPVLDLLPPGDIRMGNNRSALGPLHLDRGHEKPPILVWRGAGIFQSEYLCFAFNYFPHSLDGSLREVAVLTGDVTAYFDVVDPLRDGRGGFGVVLARELPPCIVDSNDSAVLFDYGHMLVERIEDTDKERLGFGMIRANGTEPLFSLFFGAVFHILIPSLVP